MSVGGSVGVTPISARSYFLCSTPRTGSTLLCGLLESTAVAGRPASYFRESDEAAFAARWGIARSREGAFPDVDFLRAAVAAGSTDNGVFAARIMWGTLDVLVNRLGSIYPDLVGGDLELLTRTFGRPRFVYLRRQDVVGQAVSWFRAEQSDMWHSVDRSMPPDEKKHLVYDFDGIHKFVRTIHEHNVAWTQWFASVDVQPYTVLYEDLDADPVRITQDVIQFLGLELGPDLKIIGRHERMRDRLNAEWIERYRNEVDTR